MAASVAAEPLARLEQVADVEPRRRIALVEQHQRDLVGRHARFLGHLGDALAQGHHVGGALRAAAQRSTDLAVLATSLAVLVIALLNQRRLSARPGVLRSVRITAPCWSRISS